MSKQFFCLTIYQVSSR